MTVQAPEHTGPRSEAAPVRRRDMRAWELLVREQHGRVFNMLLRLTSDREIAADLTQEAFIQAYRSAESFAGRAQPATWLCGIALNAYRSWRRRAGKAEAEEGDVDSLPDPAPAAEELALLRERNGALRAAVDRLPDAFRRAVALHYFADLPAAEIAQAEGVDPATVRWRLHAAMKKLWLMLEPELREGEPA